MIIHDISIKIFNQENDMQLLKEEIKIFNNGLNFIKNSKWIFTIENRQTKKYNSVLIFFETKEKTEKAIQNRL